MGLAKQIKIFLIVMMVLSLVQCSKPQADEEIKVENLACEMLTNPIGIDAANPRLSWMISSSQRDIQQTAYQLIVASSLDKLQPESADVWNSGKIDNNKSIHVLYDGIKLQSNNSYFWKVKVWTKNGESKWSESASWSMGLLNYNDWQGRWIGFDRSFPWDKIEQLPKLSARYFRTEFSTASNKKVKRATAYILGLGLYQIYINGEKIGTQELAPTPTDFTKNVKYNAFDVTKNMHLDKNAIGVILGNGYYSAMRPNYKPYKIKDFGYPKLLFNLIVEYNDGSKEVVKTMDDWKGTAEGPIRANNTYDGEIYDARMEMPGWTQPGFDDSNWLQAKYVQEPRGEFEAQMNENMRVMDSIQPISIKEQAPEVYIFDMGQNMAGWLKIKVKGNRGDKVTLRFAESLTEKGELFTAPLRDAKVTDTYILKGGDVESWQPSFVYHGFRFVEITGLSHKPKLTDFLGCVVYDNMLTTGKFETSNPLINQIYKNAFWSINGTYKGMPIDCPQRNERMPWLGDRAVGCYGESFVLDNSKLYLKWLDDIRYSQKADGSISDVAPAYFRYYSDNMTWPGTYLFVADMLHVQFGITTHIAEHYPNMKKWLVYMMDNYMEDYILTKDSYGDWCEPPASIEEGRGKSANVKYPSQLISTAYLYKYLCMMQNFASISGNEQDIDFFESITEKVKTAFNTKFYNAERAFYGQRKLTDNLLAVYFKMVPENELPRVLNTIRTIIVDDSNGHHYVGLIGAQWIMRTLSDNGMADIAYKLVNNTTYPSFGYMVENGATTIWELWNATTAAPAMNSQNHVMMLGDLIIWYNEYLAGIKSDSKETGFKKTIMNPVFPKDLSFVNASYESMYGTIKSHWQKTENSIEWNIQIPANTTAEIHVPTQKEQNISDGNTPITKANGVRKIQSENNKIILILGSGIYKLKITTE